MTSNNTAKVLSYVEIEENNQQVIERPVAISQNLNAPLSCEEDVEEPPPCEEDVEEPTSPKKKLIPMLQLLDISEKFVELTPISKNLCDYVFYYFLLFSMYFPSAMQLLFLGIAEVYYEYYNEDDLLVDEDYLTKEKRSILLPIFFIGFFLSVFVNFIIPVTLTGGHNSLVGCMGLLATFIVSLIVPNMYKCTSSKDYDEAKKYRNLRKIHIICGIPLFFCYVGTIMSALCWLSNLNDSFCQAIKSY